MDLDVGGIFLWRKKTLAGALAVLRIHGIDVIFVYFIFETLIL